MRSSTSSTRTALAACTVAALLAGAAACAANPGPPPLVSQDDLGRYEAETQTTTVTSTTTVPKQEPDRIQVEVGIDPVRNGFNPHLQSDEQASVRAIADLVLPSAFVGGVKNDDLIVNASPLVNSPAAMTVRYVIAPEAQWSDGTPINGDDFVYLWRAMRSTPGTVDPAGYDAISNIRVSGGTGKTVDVDFRTPVRNWRELFTYLVPSHLLRPDGSDFAEALRYSIPASAGRFLFSGVDTSRGAVTLNRNDRFWGPNPAAVDILELQYVRSTTQMADQLRSHQLSYVDRAPDETTLRVLGLLPNTQVRVDAGPRTLGVTATTGLSVEARRELFSLIDAPLLASIATGRSSDLDIPPAATAAVEADAPAETTAPETAAETTAETAAADTAAAETAAGAPAAPPALAAHIAAHGPLRIAADPADPAAYAAARSLVDLLVSRGVRAAVLTTDPATLMSKTLPGGGVAAVVGWRLDAGTSTEIAGRAACPAHAFRAANLSGFCSSDTEKLASDVLSGAVSVPAAAEQLAAIEAREAVWLPVVKETRVVALGAGIEGPDPDLARWQGGLETAPTWRVPKAGAATTAPKEKQ